MLKPATSYRVAIAHHGFIPPYRVPLYKKLNEKNGAEYVIYWGQPLEGTGLAAADGPFNFSNVETKNYALRIGPWAVILQPGVLRIATGEYDAVVIGHELKFLTNLLVFLACRLRRVPVLFWGQGIHVRSGVHENEAAGGISRMIRRVKIAMARSANGYIVYTSKGAELLHRDGVNPENIWPVRNTVDMSEMSRLCDDIRDEELLQLRSQLGLSDTSDFLLFVGRLIPGKQVDELPRLLIETRRRLKAPKRIDMLVVGDGPERKKLESSSARLDGLHLLGAIYEPRDLSRIMKLVKAVVIPGPVGLIVNQAFANGRPIITSSRSPHGPEIEYVLHNQNGLIVDGDIKALASAVADYLDDPSLQGKLTAGSLKTREELGMDHMVREFDRAVRTTILRMRQGDRKAGGGE